MSQILKPATAILAFFVMMEIFVTLTYSCEPEMNEMATLEYKTKESDILAYGYPRLRTRDNSVRNEEVYIVDFEVRCIFKGGPLPEMIRIHNVGKKDRMCMETKMSTNTPLIVYLMRDGDRLVPSYKEDPGEPQFLEELPIICGVTVTYAIGYSMDNFKEECPEEWDDDDCVPLPTEPTTESGSFTTQASNPVDKEPPYQPVRSLEGKLHENNKEVKIGDEASKGSKGGKGGKGGKKSENLEATTPDGGRAGHNTASLIMSLGAVAVCLFVHFVRV